MVFIALYFKMCFICLLQLADFNPNPADYDCTTYVDGRGQVYSYASGVDPLQAEPLLTWSGANPTSIITLTERSHTVAVVGTEDGQLLKVCISDPCFCFKQLCTNTSIDILMSYDLICVCACVYVCVCVCTRNADCCYHCII